MLEFKACEFIVSFCTDEGKCPKLIYKIKHLT